MKRAWLGKTLLGPSGAALVIGIVGLACRDGASSRSARPANVLLISLDSTRRDLLSAYGHRPRHAPGVATTPNIDSLAEQGVLFEDAYSTSSWTLPSHCAILTGQPDLVHAVELEIYSLDGSHPTLAEILREAGYRTAGFFSGPHLEPGFGFDRGFDRYAACYGDELRASSARALERARALRSREERGMGVELLAAFDANVEAQRELELAAQRDVSSKTVSDAVIEELALVAQSDRPFFVFAHFFDPHFDYTPPAPFDELFDPDYDGALTGEDFFRNPAVARPEASSPGGRVRVASDRDLEHLRALYAGDLAWTDRQVGRILAALDAQGLSERTIVAVVADHGDEFFEHGGIGHRRTLYEEVIQVPMLLRFPGVLPAGKRVAGPVSTADLVPSLLDLLDVRPGSELVARSLVGRMLPSMDETPATPLPGVMSRLVRTNPVRVQTTVDGEQVVTPVDRVTVVEAFRYGSVKITRERDWLKPPAGLAAPVGAAIQDLSRRMYADERLRWIDIERTPGETETDYSVEFSDPRARRALLEFRDDYRRLVARRRTAAPGEQDDQLRQALRGLGYAESLEVGGEVALDEFVLPPPGGETLGGG